MNTKQKLVIWSICSAFSFLLFIILLTFTIININELFPSILLIIGVISTLIVSITLLYFAVINFTYSRELIKKSFNGFIEEIITKNDMGLLIFDVNQKIIWSSTYIKKIFDNDYIGLNLTDFLKTFDKELDILALFNDLNLKVDYGSKNYQLQFWPINNSVIIKDISSEELYKKEAWEQKSVIGEIEIDNYQLFQSYFSEEEIFYINKLVIDTLNLCVEKYNFIYRQYTNGKFVVITNELSLQKMMDDNFDIILNINDQLKKIDVSKVTLSCGFSHGWSSLKSKLEFSKKALLQSQSRGGDQVSIFANDQSPIYYGSNSEILKETSRTKIKDVAKSFEKILLQNDIENVIIYGHTFADLDAIGSAMGIYEIAKSFYKNAYICCESKDSTVEKHLNDLFTNPKTKNIFIKSYFANKITNNKTVVVLVDNSHPARTDNIHALNNCERENIFILDHHRVSNSIDFCLKRNAYIDTVASSASEIVTEMISFLDYRVKISSKTAQYLLNGIYLDTNNFSKSTSPRTFYAASWLEEKGAQSSISSELLKIDFKTQEKVQKLIENAKEVKPGFFLAYSEISATNDEISIASNELLKIKDRVASFVVAKLTGTNTYKLSARGINTNVQVICEGVGGGGHFNSAAAQTNEKLDIFIDNLVQVINTSK